MSILTSNEILKATQSGKIDIRPFRTSQLNPNSYNLTLGKTLLTYDTTHALDLQSEPKTFEIEIPPEGYVLQPNILYLGHTNEVTYTKSYAPFIEGRSSIGRMGISVHITAGFGDIGFNGTWTLEITVVHPVRVYADVEICQIAFHTVEGDAVVRYVGKYNNQTGPRPSGIWKEFKNGRYAPRT
jgi:dCTP deaminase